MVYRLPPFFSLPSLYLLITLCLASACGSEPRFPDLDAKVTVITDTQGISHIFAESEEDLFFSQGYLAARNRLFQFELWRRQATGTLSEILGERELLRDIGVRLFRYRGDKEQELSHYHPRGVAIVDAFVNGINAYIDEALRNPEDLPIEFAMLGIQPEKWTWEVVISRHQGLLQNVQQELNYSRIVSLIGPKKTKELFHFHPFDPDLRLSPSIPKELLFKDILAPYAAFRSPLTFLPTDIEAAYRSQETSAQESGLLDLEQVALESADAASIGSNNWVISGELSASGFPIMANDPHRAQAVPSLRYWVGLHAPGWNLVGGGEPTIPGASIGHNGFGAWGLTIFQTDMEDLRVYDIDPTDPHRYRYQNRWHRMEKVTDTLRIKDKADTIVHHLYTVHGPVTFIDQSLHKAVAVECAWLRVGGAPYLASLRMGQAQTWEEFRDACTYNHVPAENMVWADKAGNIGWQSTGISPIRLYHSGLVASPGDGTADWEGFLPMLDRPSSFNPEVGFIATANENQVDTNYPHPEALGFTWADSFRGDRIKEVLATNKKFTVEEMGNLQNDYLSLPARVLVSELQKIESTDTDVSNVKSLFGTWDYMLNPESVAAGIYVMWERKIRSNMATKLIPKEVAPYLTEISMTKTLQWISSNDPGVFGVGEKEELLRNSLHQALNDLTERFGSDWNDWKYGQTGYKHALIRHPLGSVVSDEWREKLELGPVPRGGYSFTPGANAYGDNNTTGASFRIVVDTGDFEQTLGANNPGQSGRHDSPFYRNMFELWWQDQFFRVPFSKSNVEKKAHSKETLY
ncbi:penicillin acylase [Lunatimonas lonarensis]|uniref:Penicillin acylase n=1 Tax=Lunatimonas lonarensis TaxID=1232681 RepID=R7ZVJ8_9BACT|nr:penicillin acylase family protein [Lunatimonas lonarensis]EON78171.1 penicillin acylase [Lunatimonas lonarensis]